MENKKEKRQGAAPGYDKEGERLEKQMCPPAGTKIGKGKKKRAIADAFLKTRKNLKGRTENE